MRMPDGSSGLRWSNGIMFLLTVMPQRSSTVSAILPVTFKRRHVDQHQVIVGAAADQLQAAAHASTSASVLALSMMAWA